MPSRYTMLGTSCHEGYRCLSFCSCLFTKYLFRREIHNMIYQHFPFQEVNIFFAVNCNKTQTYTPYLSLPKHLFNIYYLLPTNISDVQRGEDLLTRLSKTNMIRQVTVKPWIYDQKTTFISSLQIPTNFSQQILEAAEGT